MVLDWGVFPPLLDSGKVCFRHGSARPWPSNSTYLLLNALSTFPLLRFLYNNSFLGRNADQYPPLLASLGGVSESISHGGELQGRSTAEIGVDSLGVAANDFSLWNYL